MPDTTRVYDPRTGKITEPGEEKFTGDTAAGSPIDLRPDAPRAYDPVNNQIGIQIDGEFQPISREQHFYEKGVIPKVEKQIEQYEEELRDFREKIEGTKYITEDEKRNRILEIDMEITKLQQDQRRAARQQQPFDTFALPGPGTAGVSIQMDPEKQGEMKRINEEIIRLAKERRNLAEDLKPVSEEEKRDIRNNYGAFDGFGEIKMHEKYGVERSMRIYREAVSDQLDVLAKARIKVNKPENIISYDNILFGKEPELKHTDQAGLDKIWEAATTDPDYADGDYAAKRKILHQKVKEFLSDKEGIEDKESASYNILSNLLTKFAQSDDGNFTIEGLKLYAEHMSNRVNSMMEYLQGSLSQVKDEDPHEEKRKFDQLERQYGKDAVRQWYNTLMSDAFQLRLVQDQLDKILKMPEARRGLKDAGKGFLATPAHELMLGVYQLAEAMNVNKIVDKVNDGRELTFSEDLALKAYATINYAGNYDTESTVYKATKGMVEMLPYIAEFLISGPTYSAIRGAALKGTTKLARGVIGRQATFRLGKKIYNVADLAALNLARVAGTAVRPIAIPQMPVTKSLQNIRDDVVLNPTMEGIEAEVLKNTGDPLAEGIGKGYWSAFSELFTEKMGRHIMRVIPFAGKIGKQLSGKQMVQRTVLDRFMKLKGIQSIEKLGSYISRNKLGWDGIMEEYLEEVANYYMETAVTGERVHGKEFWDQQLVTFLTVAGFGAFMKPVQLTLHGAVGHKMKYTMETPEGEIKTVNLPRQVHQDLMKIVGKPGAFIDDEAITGFFDKYKGELSREQFDLLMHLTVQEGQKKAQEFVATHGPGRAAKRIDEDELKPEQEITEPAPELSKEEVSEIEEENRKIIAEHPDLARLDLLTEDPATGQLLSPSETVIEQTHQQIADELAEKAEYDQFGNVTNLTPEIERLVEQEETLSRYKDEMHDRSVDFEDLSISDKQERLSIELREGKTLKGKTTPVTDRRFQVELKDGRKVDVWFHRNLAPDVEKKARKAINNHEKVELRLQDWQEWNPDRNITDESGVPYEDRIQAWIGENPVGAVRVTDFREKRARAERAREDRERAVGKLAESTKEFFEGFAVKKAYSDEERRDQAKKFIQMVKDAGVLAGVEVQIAVQRLIEYIRELTNIDDEQKGYLIALVNQNKKEIERIAAQQRIKEKGYARKAEELSIDNLVIPSIEGVAPSGAQKIDAFLNGYAPVWKGLSESLEVSKESVEKAFYQIARRTDALGSLQNEAVFSYFLEGLYAEDRINDAIVDLLRRSSISSVLSLFNFYGNVRLTKQYGMLFNGSTFSMKLLNPSEKYDDFVNSFTNAVKRYEHKGYTGYEALRHRIYAHNEQREELFHSKNQDYSWYWDQSAEQREELRRTQHERDIELLGEFTGIPTDTWREYFTSQTKETMAKPTKDAPRNAEYTTYDNLLAHDTYRGNYPRIQSNIAFNLGFGVIYNREEKRPRTLEEFKEAFEVYFLRGNETTGALSNLYKLSTAIQERDEIGLSGIDVKGDRFSSFVQRSHLFNAAENIRRLNVDNRITRFYRDKDKEMEVVLVNGLHNTKVNRGKKGTHTVNLSSEDLWLTQMDFFLQEGDTYLHWLGQFGDKPAVYFAEVPKETEITSEKISALKKKFPDFDKAVKWVHDEYIQLNQSFFNSFLLSPTKDIDARKRERMDIARNFVYNFAVNMESSNKIFHGSQESYNDLTDIVKRGGSTNSPGYVLNPYIEGGVGETFQFALIEDPTFLGLEAFDGEEFMSADYAERTQVSMGSTLSKVDQEGNEILTTTKSLFSTINYDTGYRGLTKTNRLNIEILASAFPGSKFEHIRDFMKAHSIDVLAGTSGTKKSEMNPDRKAVSIKLWDEEGNLLKKPVIPENSIIARNTSDVFVQQDLRHSTEGSPTNMPSQIPANMQAIENGVEISRKIFRLQVKVMAEMVREFDGKKIDDVKIKWLKDLVNENTQPDLYRLLEAGMTPYEPSFANFMRKMLSSELTRKALGIPINRITTIEILDPGTTGDEGLLKGRTRYTHNNEEHILLPEIASNVDGGRYENTKFEGRPEEAVKYVRRNKGKHLDLFTLGGELMEWEIYGRDGVIPGELMISNRVPGTNLHSHTVGRLKVGFPAGNFTMLDKESQRNSGSDADGDQRFNQVFYKDKNGNIVEDEPDQETREGLANDIMRLMAEDYMNPAFDTRVKSPINTEAYDPILDVISEKEKRVEYTMLDPRGYDRARNENMVGVKMKGIMTDAVTTYSLIANRNIPFKSTQQIGNVKLTGFVKDPLGYMKEHLANFVNLAFDNAADPKIERLGLNEHTANMFVIALLGNRGLDTRNQDEILKYIEKIAKYFTSPIMRDFTERMRRDSGGMRAVDLKDVAKNLKNKYKPESVDQMISFYKRAREFPDLRRFYSLTQNAPGSVVEYVLDQSLYDKVRNNGFRFIDVKRLFGKNDLPIVQFASSAGSLRVSKDYIFEDTFDQSIVGQELYRYISTLLRKKPGGFTMDQLISVSRGINNMAAIRAIGVKQNMRSLESELLSNLDSYREKYPDNLFLETVQKVRRKGNDYLEILPDYRKSKIGDVKLANTRNDFDRLSDDLKDKFAAYALYRWGATTSTFGGSYYNLFGDGYRIDLSLRMQEELLSWQLNELSSVEKLQIGEWILRASRDPNLRKVSAVNPAYENYYDYNSLSTIDFPISYEAMDGLHGVSSMEDLSEYSETHQFDAEALLDYIEKQTGSRKVVRFAKGKVQEFRDRAMKFFPPNTTAPEPLRDMMPSSGIGEALASEDPELQDFIFTRLRKMYPGVRIFASRDSFMEFVEKHGGRGFNVNPEAIGNAFKNAIRIDPEKAEQSTMFHEYAHIYWDALPDDNNVKTDLRNMYYDLYADKIFTLEDLDEMIIIDIGKAGVERGRLKFEGLRLERFMDLLRQFWIEVKKLLGFASRQDLVDDLTNDIWENSGRIRTETAFGEAVVHNMISYNFSSENMPGFNGAEHTHYIGDKPVTSVTSVIGTELKSDIFNPSAVAMKSAQNFERIYSNYTKERLGEKELEEEAQADLVIWDEKTERGNTAHKVAESVFGNAIITKDDIAWFEDPADYRKLRNKLLEIKDHILARFPKAEFYPERHVISKKFKIGGFVDLVVDIGDNKLLVYDFKTVESQLADDEGKALPDYKKAYGLMKPPFQHLSNSKYTEHMLQTNMYSSILEEQTDPEKPGQVNQVVEVRIVPIIRKIDPETGKFTDVKLGNVVKIPRNDKTIQIAERVMGHSVLLREDFDRIYPDFKANLEKLKVAPVIIKDTLTAFHFVKQLSPDVSKFSRANVSDARTAGLQAMKGILIDRGFDMSDFRGPRKMSFEELFYIAYAEKHITKQMLLDPDSGVSLDSLFPEQEVYKKLTPKPNPAAKKSSWHRVKLGDKDYLLQDVGINNASVGDDVMRIYDFKWKSGRMGRNHYRYTILKIDKKKRRFFIHNVDSGEDHWVSVPGKTDGFLKIHADLPEGVQEPGEDSFVSRYIYEAESIREKHYKSDFKIGEPAETVEGEQERNRKERQLREIWKFFRQYDDMEKVEEFLNDEKAVEDFYEIMASVDAEFGTHLQLFIRDEGVNNMLASAVRRELQGFEDVPDQLLPMTTNLYYMLTMNQKEVWKNFDRLNTFRLTMPARMIEMRFVPLSMFTTQTAVSIKKYNQEAFDLTRSFRRFARGKVNVELLIVEDGERLYWRRPTSAMKEDHPLEFEFLKELYRYYEYFDPEMKRYKDTEQGLTKRIPVTQIFASRSEMIDRYGGKWGPVLYQRLQPKAYDHVKVKLIHEINKETGEVKYLEDSDGKPVYRTLKQIKEGFIFDRSDPVELAKILGPRWKNIMRIPGTVPVAGKAGLLNHYIKQAIQIYRKGGDQNNLSANINQSKRRIPMAGKGSTVYATEHYVEAEEKSINSMMKRFYLKRMMAPLDWMLDMYGSYSSESKDEDNLIMKYLRVWGEYQLYGKKPTAAFEWLGSQTMSDLVDVGNRANSWNKILFSLKTQFINLAIGQGMDIIREPGAYIRGLERMFGSGGPIKNITKAWRILRRYKLANIVSDVTFDQIDKEFRLMGIDLSKIEKVGFWPMEAAEKLNQFPIFIGLMTDAEWNAYDSTGKVVDKKNAMSFWRALMLEGRVQDIHGDYGTENAAPLWLGNTGKALLQFRKWLPAMIWAHLAPYHIDRNMAVRSGILPTVHLMAKVISYNVRTTQEKQEQRAKKIEEMAERGEFANEAFFRNVSEYMDTLVHAVNGKKIQWKDLSESDKRNIRSFAIEVMLYAAMTFTYLAIMGPGDEKTFRDYRKRIFAPLFKRYQGDVFWIFTPDNWQYFSEQMVPMISIIAGSVKFMSDATWYIYSLIDPTKAPNALYNKDTLVARKGFPKFIVSGSYIAPGGSLMRHAAVMIRRKRLKRTPVDLEQFGLTSEDLIDFGVQEGELNEFNLIEMSYKYERIMRDLRQAAKYNALKNKNIDPDWFMDLETGEDLLRSEADQLKDLLRMIQIEQQALDGEIDLEQVQKDAAEYRKLEKARQARPKRKTKRKFREAIQQK